MAAAAAEAVAAEVVAAAAAASAAAEAAQDVMCDRQPPMLHVTWDKCVNRMRMRWDRGREGGRCRTVDRDCHASSRGGEGGGR